MDPLLIVWTVAGALVVVALIGAVWTGAALATMRRLGATVDERWHALSTTLEQRREAAEPLLATATEPQRARAEAAFAALEQAVFPSGKAEAEAEVQQALRPIAAAAAAQASGTDAFRARAALAAIEDEAQQRRRDYNTGARELNARLRRFPTSLWASAAGGRRDFFEVDQSGAVAEPPRIQF